MPITSNIMLDCEAARFERLAEQSKTSDAMHLHAAAAIIREAAKRESLWKSAADACRERLLHLSAKVDGPASDLPTIRV